MKYQNFITFLHGKYSSSLRHTENAYNVKHHKSENFSAVEVNFFKYPS